jgi:hypothetical protein
MEVFQIPSNIEKARFEPPFNGLKPEKTRYRGI